jgi:hypothetical protein
MALSEEQRWLLAGVGGWQMADCLAYPNRGIPQLMASMYGASNGRRDGRYPEWLSGGFSCGHGRIVSPCLFRDGVRRVEVTKAQLLAFSRQLNSEVCSRLREVRATQQQEAVAWADACNCAHIEVHEDTNPAWSRRWHPSPERAAAHRTLDRLLDRAVTELVLEACGLAVTEGQLAIFGDTAAFD